MTPLFRLANKRSLLQDDLYGVAKEDDVADISARFESLLSDRLGNPSKYRFPVRAALVAQFWWPMTCAGFVKLLNSTLQFIPSLLLWQLLGSIQSSTSDSSDWHGFAYAGAMFVAMTARTLTENNYFQAVTKVGFHCRSALSTAVYRKSLRMSPVARQDTPIGTIVNLMQLDAQRIDSLIQMLHVTWDAWYQIAGVSVLLSNGMLSRWCFTSRPPTPCAVHGHPWSISRPREPCRPVVHDSADAYPGSSHEENADTSHGHHHRQRPTHQGHERSAAGAVVSAA